MAIGWGSKNVMELKRSRRFLESNLGRTLMLPEERFRAEWEEMLSLYGVLTRSEHAAIRDRARSKLAAKLHEHGLKGVRDILRMPASDPAAIVEALAPRALLPKPVDPALAHFGPAVTSENEADFVRVRDQLIARHKLEASIKPAHYAMIHGL